MYILCPNDICLCYRRNFFIHLFNICWMNACRVEDNSQTQKCNRKYLNSLYYTCFRVNLTPLVTLIWPVILSDYI